MGEPTRRMRRTSGGLWVPGGDQQASQPARAGDPGGDESPAGDEALESAGGAERDGGELRTRLEAAEAEAREHRESWLRVLADFENVRRRSATELSEARDRGRSEVLLPLLDVLDDVDRALAAGGAGPEGAGVEEENPFRSGVRLIRARLAELLRSQGVEEIPAGGTPFDPHVHEAVMQVSTADVPPDHVAQVLSPGYRLGERVLRPARVAVARDPDPFQTT